MNIRLFLLIENPKNDFQEPCVLSYYTRFRIVINLCKSTRLQKPSSENIKIPT